MKFLFLFLDGVGIGEADPERNPFARASLPCLENLLAGRKLVAGNAPLHTDQVSLVELDASLGVPGLPQSGSGQAVLLTGRNVPAEIGYHYGPKPDLPIARLIQAGNVFHTLAHSGFKAGLLNAYPPGYFQEIESGKRLYSAIPLAVTSAGLSLKTAEDYQNGQALSADFTGQGWRDHLGYSNSPVYSPEAAGHLLASLAMKYDFSFFEYWLSDYTGHAQDMEQATSLLAIFDEVLAGLLATWNQAEDLILITSDHGNLEDLGTRRHTGNPVPALLIGHPTHRQQFTQELRDLAGITPAIYRLFGV